MPENHCWGCGPANSAGLQLKSRWAGDSDVAVAVWSPSPAHAAGPTHVLNGGVIATLLDCHSICTAIADAYRREGRSVGDGERIWFVTGRIEVDYLAPTPIDAPVELSARVVRSEGRKSWVDAELRNGGKPRARARTLALRVSDAWLRGSA